MPVRNLFISMGLLSPPPQADARIDEAGRLAREILQGQHEPESPRLMRTGSFSSFFAGSTLDVSSEEDAREVPRLQRAGSGASLFAPRLKRTGSFSSFFAGSTLDATSDEDARRVPRLQCAGSGASLFMRTGSGAEEGKNPAKNPAGLDSRRGESPDSLPKRRIPSSPKLDWVNARSATRTHTT